MSEPRIVWPALALPALVEHGGHGGFDLIVAQRKGTQDHLAAWAPGLALEARNGRRVALSVENVERDVADARVSGLNTLASSQEFQLSRLRVQVSEPIGPAAPRSAAVFDLVAPSHVVRRNAVGVLGNKHRRLALAFASDLHIAAMWDTVAAAVERHAADLVERLNHPSRMLERFVQQANGMAARGELDLVVLGGDLVDHVRRDDESPRAGFEDTNAAALAAILSRLDAPVFAIPGNHDFRLFPPRLRLSSLETLGIPAARRPAVLQAAGLWDRFPLRRSDRRALQSHDESGESALAAHFSLLAPATDFSVEANGVRLVFASTGRDILPHWRTVGWQRWSMMARSLPTSWEDPDSEGLTTEQIERITSELSRGGGTALFHHAPLLHGGPGAQAERLGRVTPPDSDHGAAAIGFERRLQAAGLRRGVFFRNPAGLVRALASAAGPVITFSGHVHHASAIRFNRRTLAVRSAAVTAAEVPDQEIPLITAPSLSHVRVGAGRAPGYVYVRFEDGAAVHAETRTL